MANNKKKGGVKSAQVNNGQAEAAAKAAAAAAAEACSLFTWADLTPPFFLLLAILIMFEKFVTMLLF